jgi:ABC-type multidrug transport system fused ATPase/permease subunit
MPLTLYAYIWRTSRRGQIILCVLSAIVSVLTAVPLELQRRIVDDALPHGQLPLLLLLSAVYLGILLLQGGLKYGLNVYRGRLVEDITRKLRLTVYEKTRSTAADGHVRHGKEPAEKGAIVSIVASEVEELAGFVGDSISFPLLQGGTAAVVVGYLLWVQPIIAIFAILLYLPQLVIVPLGQNVINKLAVAYARLVRRIGDLIVEPTDATDGQAAPSEGYKTLVDETYETRVHIYRIKFFLTFFGNLLDAIGPLLVLAIGGWLVVQGRVEIGTLVVFISGFQKVADPWDQLTSFYRLLSNARVKYRLIADTLPDGSKARK